MSETGTNLGFWKTVRLLLGAAKKRSNGRRKRQQELLSQRNAKTSTDWSAIGYLFACLFMTGLNVCAAFVLLDGVKVAEHVDMERRGCLVVGEQFFLSAQMPEVAGKLSSSPVLLDDASYASEAKTISIKYGGSERTIERNLRAEIRDHGSSRLVVDADVSQGLTVLRSAGPLTPMWGSLILLWWACMLVFQGEGLELDLQRRRHPMWEWLLTHPVPPGAVFLAEMISPIAANPAYWGAPLFAGVTYGFVYGPLLGMVAALVVGVPVTVALACVGKSLEIAVTLRLSTRSRGATIGLMSWFGYTSMMLFFFGLYAVPSVVTALSPALSYLAVLPWPWLGLFLGSEGDGSFSFPLGVLTCVTVSGVLLAGAVWFSAWATEQGLSGSFAQSDRTPTVKRRTRTRFGKEPLYRKELLWFLRDRSAIVQAILIPITLAGLQLFNLRALLVHAQDAWNYLCGAAILFGTYFLWVLGPKSLQSEGTALWVALTWPRGLESLLKAKAWLWSLLSSGLVLIVLIYAAVLFPRDIWKIVLLGAGWFVFGRSIAEKSVTLVTVTSESGEVQKLPRGRILAAQLGTLTFAVGVMTQQWNVAIVGIVYSWITAAAMWQNFRARLPYLYDPWSETLPPPPTLMHAMISISILVEGGAVVTGIVQAAAGGEYVAIVQALSYAICAVAVSFGVNEFLGNRGVSSRQIWSWQPAIPLEQNTEPWWRGYGTRDGRFLLSLLAGAAGGIALGAFAFGYLTVLRHIPFTADLLHKSEMAMARIPDLKACFGVMAVLFAPFAEEYLFRGLLFRALDREWGGWRAILGSAAFFAIYHPPLSWLPVGLVGVANALLFKKTGRLAPCVVLHMVYNAIVVAAS